MKWVRTQNKIKIKKSRNTIGCICYIVHTRRCWRQPSVRLPRDEDEDEDEREKPDLQNSLHLVFRWAAARHSNGFLSLSLFSHWFTVLHRFGGENRKKNCCCQVSQSVKEEEKGKLSIRIVKLYFTCIELLSLSLFFFILRCTQSTHRPPKKNNLVFDYWSSLDCGDILWGLSCPIRPKDRFLFPITIQQQKKKKKKGRKWRSSTIPF